MALLIEKGLSHIYFERIQ